MARYRCRVNFGWEEMVPPEGQSLNTLFETLAEWEDQLKHLDVDFDALGDNSGETVAADPEGPSP